ncbi:hypothetical protein ABIA35_009918 [Catenulispora sp. MAP12-49]|uniref:winged helix DNA-binding domain-containing protein n=1 Tax=Catenulispora sp. MAP12-49 TaxID=3156302 RepID=UPI003516B561
MSTKTMTVDWQRVSARRLARAGLAAEPKPSADSDLAATVASMAGAHAQIMSAAELSVAIRAPGATAVDVRDALWTKGTLTKTFGPRGTVHLLPTAELSTWLGALSALPPITDRFAPDVRLTPDQLDSVLTAVASALTDTELTTEELDAAVGDLAGPWAIDEVMPAFQTMWPRWRQAMAMAAHRGVLCFGAGRGRKVTYMNPEVKPADTDEALTTVVRDYLWAYGPATPPQFAKWFGGTPAWGAKVFGSLAEAGSIEEIDFDGTVAWVAAGDTGFDDAEPRGVRLLPYFDAYGIAGQPRDRLFPGRAAERALNRGQAGNRPVLLVEGVVDGIWHLKRAGRRATVTVEAFITPNRALTAAIEEQAARVGEILGVTAELVLGEVEAGPHA